MNLDPAPRLSKSTFLLIDAGLLAVAFVIVYFAKNPYAPLPFITAVLFVGAAGITGLIPYLLDFAADSAEYVQAERERAAEHVQRLHAAGESLARAAAQIKAVEEAVHKTAHAAENLPYRMQEKLAEFNQQLAQTEDEEKERLSEELDTLRQSESERLQGIADKIGQATKDWAALEAATRKHLTQAEAALTKMQRTTEEVATRCETKVQGVLDALNKASAPAEITAPPFKLPPPAAAAVIPEPLPVQTAAPTPLLEMPVAPEPTPPEPAEAETPKPRKPRAPRRPAEEQSAAAAVIAAADEPAAPVHVASASTDDGEAPDRSQDSAASSDGATRLLATAYIGIGNKLFIRGDGPGLSWDKGVPMQFVSIGKWGWATHDATTTLTCKLYKNDEMAALTGEVILEPGKHVEITALF